MEIDSLYFKISSSYPFSDMYRGLVSPLPGIDCSRMNGPFLEIRIRRYRIYYA